MSTHYKELDNQVLIDLIPILKEIYSSNSAIPIQESRYGAAYRIEDIKDQWPEIENLENEIPGDGLIRFMYTDYRDRGPHIDYPNGEYLSPMVLFPIIGCDSSCVDEWYEYEGGVLGSDSYNIFLKDTDSDNPLKLTVIDEYILKDKPVLFDTQSMHGMINKNKVYRVIARYKPTDLTLD